MTSWFESFTLGANCLVIGFVLGFFWNDIWRILVGIKQLVQEFRNPPTKEQERFSDYP